jgi:hypothetical protein
MALCESTSARLEAMPKEQIDFFVLFADSRMSAKSHLSIHLHSLPIGAKSKVGNLTVTDERGTSFSSSQTFSVCGFVTYIVKCDIDI